MVKLELYPNSHCSFSPCTHIKYCDTGCEVLDSMDVYFFFRHLYVVGRETKRQLKRKGYCCVILLSTYVMDFWSEKLKKMNILWFVTFYVSQKIVKRYYLSSLSFDKLGIVSIPL